MAELRPIDLLDVRLRPLCEAILRDAQIPGASVAIVVGGRHYHLAWGVKSMLSAEPVTARTGFGVGSCSKAFVSTLLASLVADGLASWDDPIVRWVPEFRIQDEALLPQVSLRDLSANRLGVPGAGLPEFGMDPTLPTAHVFEAVRHTPQATPFRSRFMYFNVGHTANSVAASRIAGKPFLAALRERVLEPLGMASTSGGASTPHDLQDLTAWHTQLGGQPLAIDPIYTDQYLAAGGMVVAGEDAPKWLQFHLDGGRIGGRQVVPAAALAETHRPHVCAIPGADGPGLFCPGAHMAAYALGWGVSDLAGHPALMHSGGDHGLTSLTLLLPRSGLGIAVYTNCGKSAAAAAVAFGIAGLLLSLPAREWAGEFAALRPPPASAAARAPAELALGAYVGRYDHPGDGPLQIEPGDGPELRGRLQHGYRLSFRMQPLGGHRFALLFDAPEWQAASEGFEPTLEFEIQAGRVVAAALGLSFAGRVFQRMAGSGAA